MAIGALPANSKNTFDLLWDFADDIWVMCGDRSDDINYYTKRLIFIKVYASTELYMLTDKSKDYEETWSYL